MNYQGREFKCIPFGFDRRRCPGIQLGLISVKMVLTQFMHCFNWEFPCNICPSNLNMEEKFGLTIQHLHAILNYRLASDVNINNTTTNQQHHNQQASS